MKKILLAAISIFSLTYVYVQCDINTSASQMTVTCGQSVDLTAFGSSTGSMILNENFNSGSFGNGWGSTPGATSFGNPCSPGGVDGTTHAWMDNNTSVPRTLTSQAYNLTSATAGVSICFDLLFAEQGDNAPCEGPDEPDEGVYLQYSIDGGATWIDIHYFDPNGGNDPQLVNWNNWCFEIPLAAITSNTLFRWFQSADSGADYDHWGIDNVQIFQNDINAEVVWLHDGYSYGIGNPGGVNPNPVTPTSTTTYTAQITTGTGQVCTSTITITVIDPVYDVNVTANPTTLCVGECSTISGTAQIVLDPGGIETYENNEVGIITGTPGIPGFPPFIPPTPGTIDANMNINITGLNNPSVTAGQIQNVCINSLTVTPGLGCTATSLANVRIVLECPDGTQITLANTGQLSGTTITNMCFSVGGAAISTGASPYTGTFAPFQSLDGVTGCTSNGVWVMRIIGQNSETCLPLGGIGGWNITFDDPPIYQSVNATWTPAAGLSSTSTINTTACPTNTTDYVLTLDNGTQGCPTYTQTFPITVNGCGGCIPPTFTVTNPSPFCLPGSFDLSLAVSGIGVNTVSYHASNADAQADVNPLASTIVSAAGTYFVRVEDPTDPSCFSIQSIVVSTSTEDDPSFTFNDFCVSASNGPQGIVTVGGTFAFNPVSTDGATIDPITGVISSAIAGNSYSVEYTTSGACSTSEVVVVTALSLDDASFTFSNFCSTDPNAPTGIVTAGGSFSFNPVPSDGATIDAVTGSILNPVAGNSYAVSYTTSGACSAVSSVQVTALDCSSCTPPVVTITNPTAVCSPQTIDLSSAVSGAGGNIVTYHATNADASANVNPLASNVISVSGTYWVRVTDPTDATCFTVQSISVTINAVDNAAFIFASFCAGAVNGPTGIVTPSGSFSFDPQPTDGATIDATTGVISNGVAGSIYSVEYTTSGVCPSTSVQNVQVNDCSGCTPPVLTLTAGAFCQGGSYDLSNSIVNSIGSVSYSYYVSNLDATNGTNAISSQVNTSGTFWVRAEDANDPTCFSIEQVVITENLLPNILLIPQHTTCDLPNGAIDATITLGSGNYNFAWSNGAASEDLTNLPAGLFTLVVTDLTTGCSASMSSTVLASSEPTAAFAMVPSVLNFPDHITQSYNGSTNATSYQWIVNGTNYQFSSNDENIVLDLPVDAGNYEVCLLAFNGNSCVDTLCGFVEVRDEFIIYVPNTFTPDGDEFNNVFLPVVSMIDERNYDFYVYNRWGELIFETHDVSIGWDGLYNGELVQNGTYTWKIRLKSIHTDEFRDYKGHVTILK